MHIRRFQKKGGILSQAAEDDRGDARDIAPEERGFHADVSTMKHILPPFI
jgi:hypothetical protein